MERLEHIGIAVKDLVQANATFAKLLGKNHYKIETVESEGVRTSFFEVGGVKIELLEASREDSAISKFISKRGEGVHHLAFEVTDLKKTISDYEKAGYEPIHKEPRPGADNKMICFLHPRTTGGVLIELCEDIKAASSD